MSSPSPAVSIFMFYAAGSIFPGASRPDLVVSSLALNNFEKINEKKKLKRLNKLKLKRIEKPDWCITRREKTKYNRKRFLERSTSTTSMGGHVPRQISPPSGPAAPLGSHGSSGCCPCFSAPSTNVGCGQICWPYQLHRGSVEALVRVSITTPTLSRHHITILHVRSQVL